MYIILKFDFLAEIPQTKSKKAICDFLFRNHEPNFVAE